MKEVPPLVVTPPALIDCCVFGVRRPAGAVMKRTTPVAPMINSNGTFILFWRDWHANDLVCHHLITQPHTLPLRLPHSKASKLSAPCIPCSRSTTYLCTSQFKAILNYTMKATFAFLTLAISVFTNAASGEWLKSSYGHDVAAFCNPNGSQVWTPHACISVKPEFVKNIDQKASNFQGYVSEDQKCKDHHDPTLKAFGHL